MVSVSFVVIAHNEAAGIARSLASILQQDAGARSEIIVVDDGSGDATARVVGELAAVEPRLRLIELEENRGRGFARNLGISLATGDFVATVDADIILPPDWFVRCISALEATGADAVAGTATPDGDVAYVCRVCRLSPRVVPHTTTITGSNAVFRRDVFTQTGFDPDLREGEDVAINHALRATELRLYTVPDLVVEHRESKPLSVSLRWMVQSGRGASRQLFRYREVRPPDVAFMLWLVALVGPLLAPRRRLFTSSVLTTLATTAAATAHVSRSFHISETPWPRIGAAIGLDALHLACYFAGRTAALVSAVGTALKQ